MGNTIEHIMLVSGMVTGATSVSIWFIVTSGVTGLLELRCLFLGQDDLARWLYLVKDVGYERGSQFVRPEGVLI